jgi:aryl-alcohol dehydrogenase
VKIQAAVSRDASRPPELETLDIEEPRASEILVRIVATGICHTDINVHERDRAPKPIVLGHEGAGIVERVGSQVTRLAPGDPVILSSNFCGECPSCRQNAHSYCYELMPRNFGGRRPDGSTPLTQNATPINARFFGQSSFATYALADERSAVKAPPDLPLEIMGPLACGVMTGAGAVINSLQVRPGQSIAIFGTGAVGLSAVMAAKIVGATRIIAVDVVPARLALALELGATDVIDVSAGNGSAGNASAADDPTGTGNAPASNASAANAAQLIKKLTHHGVDFTFNTTRAPAIFTQAMESLAPRGVAGFVGAPFTPWTPDMFQILSGGRTLRGIIGGDSSPGSFIPLLIEYYRQGRLPFDRLIRFYPFQEIAQAFADCEHGTTVKAVLRM